MLRRIVHLFVGLDGRISRMSWWAGMIALAAFGWAARAALFRLGLAADFTTIDPTEIDLANPAPPTLARTLLGLISLYVMFALTVKRLKDRDHAIWFGFLWAVPVFASTVGRSFGVFHFNPYSHSPVEQGAFAILAVISLWFFIDNGFLKGTAGPNRYGPDPLSSGAASSPTPVPPPRRTVGAYVRDGLTAMAAVVAILVIAGVDTGFDKASLAVLRYFAEPENLRLYKERMANGPAWQASQQGNVAFGEKNYSAAIAHYSRAIELYGPEQATAASGYRGRGQAYEAMGDVQNALADYGTAVRLEPNDPMAYSLRAHLLLRNGDPASALTDLDHAIRLSPSPYKYQERSRALKDLGRVAEAIQSCTESIELADRQFKEMHAISTDEEFKKKLAKNRDDDKANGFLMRANLLRDRGMNDEALADYNAALMLQPKSYRAYLNRGLLYENSGDRNRALSDYEEAASIRDPNDWLKRAIERVK